MPMSLTFERMLAKLHAERGRFAEAYNVKRIGIFGSLARGMNTSDSDVDLLVEFSGAVGWDILDLKDDIERLLGLPVDLVTEGGLRDEFKEQVLADVVFACSA